jgi:hypothetical protein
MRKPGPIAILLVLGVPTFLYFKHLDHAYRQNMGPFAEEYGAFGFAPLEAAFQYLTIFLILGGLFLCLLDLVRWVKRRAA